MIGYLARGGSDGLGKLLSRPAHVVAGGPLTALHSVGARHGWAIRRARDSRRLRRKHLRCWRRLKCVWHRELGLWWKGR
ncbi:hypothetical protein BHE74_00031348 [Ensete ventricosum]|nr:hypothetical protein GW17_00056151 [Ensete ventricosum]RWW61592.1 hypothetical protein BHE74_00031348 [Ensete ventricosum]